jgi:hypothetical protein
VLEPSIADQPYFGRITGNSEMIHWSKDAFRILRGADPHGSARRPFGSEPKWVAHARVRDFEAFENLAQTKGPRTMPFPADAEIGFAFMFPYRKRGVGRSGLTIEDWVFERSTVSP